ncbi:MAG TPA: flippase-like domain-containing protein, partial [Motilibacterales bacterium]|nr:flippase-like domain-containing protein [Motilibacterales bacterium]
RWRWVTVSNYLVVLAQFSVLGFSIRGVLGDQSTSLTMAGAFAAFAISRMASMIPVTPGGLGTVDAALIALLTTFGLTTEQAVASTLVWRACSWIPQVSLGVLTFLYWRVAQARVGRAAPA